MLSAGHWHQSCARAPQSVSDELACLWKAYEADLKSTDWGAFIKSIKVFILSGERIILS